MPSATPLSDRPQFYGRRLGRKLRPKQQQLLEWGVGRFGITAAALASASADSPIDPRDFFASPPESMAPESVALEIGFGGGEHLAALAAQYPQRGFIGVEVFINGVASLCRHIEAQNLTNIRIWGDDVRLFLPALTPAAFDEVFLLFPDPWPKARHARRRILEPPMLDVLMQRLRVGGELLVASDDATAQSWALAACWREARLEWLAREAADWRLPPRDFPGTRYMAKAEKAGRRVAWLRFRRCDGGRDGGRDV